MFGANESIEQGLWEFASVTCCVSLVKKVVHELLKGRDAGVEYPILRGSRRRNNWIRALFHRAIDHVSKRLTRLLHLVLESYQRHVRTESRPEF